MATEAAVGQGYDDIGSEVHDETGMTLQSGEATHKGQLCKLVIRKDRLYLTPTVPIAKTPKKGGMQHFSFFFFNEIQVRLYVVCIG
jgi:hypothetical protein